MGDSVQSNTGSSYNEMEIEVFSPYLRFISHDQKSEYEQSLQNKFS